MLIALLIAGIVFLLAGLLGIAFGIPVKEFSFGNTEILAGVITACAGTIMLALWVVVRELKRAMQRLGSGVAATSPRAAFPSAAENLAPHDPASSDDGLLFNQPGSVRPADAEPAPPSASPVPPWHEESASRDRGRNETPPVLPGSLVEPAPKPRRNLLFSSTSRKERERAEGRAVDPGLADVPPPPSAPPLPPKSSETPPPTFEDAWPQSERPRSVDVSRRNRTPTPPAETDAADADRSAAARKEEPPQVTVLKSGVVDGMAYSLYSDGSIEAQMPEGMMRFASIDELRTHLDQRT
jgi:hypothetical protein